MSKKPIETPRKSPRLGEGTSNDDVHVSNFNILTQVTPTNQKGKKRKGKIVETPFDSDFDFYRRQLGKSGSEGGDLGEGGGFGGGLSGGAGGGKQS
ncbi:hypothetical protein H5410_035301 [Solanum commersonii]|uniref:Uncharacterized protein n=1 Tax=Solanum commersonii TaxID=4109 RepID=A0A9J5Y1H8_SOLCO|nr:hypothetical protein H5410_035301 [Solanum commersonii]